MNYNLFIKLEKNPIQSVVFMIISRSNENYMPLLTKTDVKFLNNKYKNDRYYVPSRERESFYVQDCD